MSNDHEWLSLIEVSGPFLAVPVLRDVFPQGLEALTPGRPQRLRKTYEEWRDAVDMDDLDLPALHTAWIDEVLVTALEMDAGVVRRGGQLPARLSISMPEHGVMVAPDLAVVNATKDDEPLLLIHVYEPDTDLDATRRIDGLAMTPSDRMVALLRGTGCPTGLVTNGERWMLVHAPIGAVSAFASWYARLWGQEPETLRAFVSLLGVRRFFGPEPGKLPALFEQSLKHQDDVTEALGEQVRRAVEVLVQAVDRADQDRNRDLLRDVDPRELYEAGLTVMMRLVFLLAAEERGLLLLGDPRYDSFYAISTLRMQLRADSEEILERRRSSWSRLLALFRGVFGGIDHPTLRLPALGGSLFDPDRYPFLEGRKKGTSWWSDPAEPLPIDDRTVLLLLEAIQTFEGRTLSYRALDVEQIGHVYEGLLERTVRRVDDVTLELEGAAKAKNARVSLGEIESARLDGVSRIADLLKERSERSEPAIRHAIGRAPDERLAARLLTVCRGDVAMRDRILPYAELLRTDPWGYPLVHHAGAFVVVLGADRRESGTHYTPKNLTERIVEVTLIPIVYRGPAEDAAREAWKLKNADELLDLKICDPAMGSGAFLVQACRWLADRLVEAWSDLEAEGGRIDDEGNIHTADEATTVEPLSRNTEERAVLARRLIAERCLYGVDKNPLAVELAKLSLWLTTLAKGRPFGFLDHNLRSGDSLLGIHDLGQLIELDMSPTGKAQLRLFGRTIRSAVDKALRLRIQLRSIPIRDIGDVEAMTALDAQSRNELALPELIADALVGIVLADDRPVRIAALATMADEAVGGDANARTRLLRQTTADLANDAPDGAARRPLHWPLQFPEVFFRDNEGFDAFIGNPPFMGGTILTENMGKSYTSYLQRTNPPWHGKADYVVGFFKKANKLVGHLGVFSFLSTASLLRGETLDSGLRDILSNGWTIYNANGPYKWPGTATLEVVDVSLSRHWKALAGLNGNMVSEIGEDLTGSSQLPAPFELMSNNLDGYLGAKLSPFNREIKYDAYVELGQLYPLARNFFVPAIGGAELYDLVDLTSAPQAIDPDKLRKYLDEHGGDKSTLEFLSEDPSAYMHSAPSSKLKSILAKVPFAFACGETSTALRFAAVPRENTILKHKLIVFPAKDWSIFAILQSELHVQWAWRWGLRRESRIVYSPKRCAKTFPLPKTSEFESALIQAGEQYSGFRANISRQDHLGLTKIYNKLHDPNESGEKITKLRDLQVVLDETVAQAYGWGDIRLEHGFHDVEYLPPDDRVQFTISANARQDVLRRLSDLNKKQHLHESGSGLHKVDKKQKANKKQAIQNAGAFFDAYATETEVIND